MTVLSCKTNQHSLNFEFQILNTQGNHTSCFHQDHPILKTCPGYPVSLVKLMFLSCFQWDSQDLCLTWDHPGTFHLLPPNFLVVCILPLCSQYPAETRAHRQLSVLESMVSHFETRGHGHPINNCHLELQINRINNKLLLEFLRLSAPFPALLCKTVFSHQQSLSLSTVV